MGRQPRRYVHQMTALAGEVLDLLTHASSTKSMVRRGGAVISGGRGGYRLLETLTPKFGRERLAEVR